MMTGMVLDNSPSDVERWTKTFVEGAKRWKGVEQRRLGLGDGFHVNNQLIAEMNYTMREIKMRIRLPKTHQQRAIQFGMAQLARDPMAAKAGWVELTIDADAKLQDALTLARQAYMETQR